jgi:hypothetical protein
MFFSNFLRRMRARVGHSRGAARHAHTLRSGARRPVLEALEDRCLPSGYGFTLIADNGPSSIFTLGALNQPGLNDEGTVMFHSALKSGPIGVFTVDNEGSLTTIARTDLVGATDMFLGGAITDEGTVSLGANLVGGGQAVFTGAGQELTRIADTGAGSPFSSFLAPAAPINNDDMLAFRATLKSGGTGIFTDSAGEPPQTLYLTGGQFTALFQPVIERNGNEMAFRATLTTGQQGVFLGDGQTTTTIATTDGTYSAFVGGVPNDEGRVAFIANLTSGGQAIVTGDGTQLETIADTTSGQLSSFLGNTATINNDGQVVFAANLVGGGSGIFIAQHHKVTEIIGTGDPLFGSAVTSFTANPFAGRGFNNEGQLGFAANLTDGRTVIVRADPLQGSNDPSGYQQINLVAEVPGVAAHTDPNLNGWGMDVFPNGPYVAASITGPVSTIQTPALAPMSPLLIESLSQSAVPQDTSSAGQPGTLQPIASDVSSSVTAAQSVPALASAGEPILQTSNSQTTTNALDGLFVGLGNGEVDLLSEFAL